MTRGSKDFYKTRLRQDKFSTRPTTRIWAEIPAPQNPYIAAKCLCHGYDLLELIEKRTFIDVLYLLFRGELPTPEQAEVLETLMIGLINPGPRHPSTRAAMNAGVGKTDAAHILPISLLALGGGHLGGHEVVASMRFLNKGHRQAPTSVVAKLLSNTKEPNRDDGHIAPGFGTRFGGIDVLPKHLASKIGCMPGNGKVLKWGQEFAYALEEQAGCGWLATGITAAVLSDLGFHPRAGAGLYQLFSAPGLLAHGLEMANKPLTAMPFPDDEHYVIEK